VQVIEKPTATMTMQAPPPRAWARGPPPPTTVQQPPQPPPPPAAAAAAVYMTPVGQVNTNQSGNNPLTPAQSTAKEWAIDKLIDMQLSDDYNVDDVTGFSQFQRSLLRDDPISIGLVERLKRKFDQFDDHNPEEAKKIAKILQLYSKAESQ
jgi:hypothetical protein